MKLKPMHRDVYIGLLLYIVSAFFLIMSSKLPRSSAVFPNLLIIAFAILNTSVLYRGIQKTRTIRDEDPEAESPMKWDVIKKPLFVFILILIYVVLFKLTNFFIATTIFMIALMKFYKVTSWKNIICVSVIFNIIAYVGFVKALKVPLI